MISTAKKTAPRLMVRRGPNPDHIYSMSRGMTVIGREPINDVVVADPELSRRHARIFWEKTAYYIEDLNSTNGTYVNGRRISAKTRLSSGDIIDFGETVRMIFEHDIDPASEIDVSSYGLVEEPVFPGDRATASPMRPIQFDGDSLSTIERPNGLNTPPQGLLLNEGERSIVGISVWWFVGLGVSCMALMGIGAAVLLFLLG